MASPSGNPAERAAAVCIEKIVTNNAVPAAPATCWTAPMTADPCE